METSDEPINERPLEGFYTPLTHLKEIKGTAGSSALPETLSFYMYEQKKARQVPCSSGFEFNCSVFFTLL